MKLPRPFRARDSEERIPPEVQEDLDAVDAALADRDVPPELEDLGLLAKDLQEMRPEPGMRFEAELDEWAAEGFPRGNRPGVSVPAPGRDSQSLLARFSPLGPRGWAPVAATATAVVVVCVSIAQLGDSTDSVGDGGAAGESSAPSLSREAPADAEAPAATTPDATGGAIPEQGDDELNQAVPNPTELPPGPSAPSFEDASRLELSASDTEVDDALDQAVGIIEGRGGIVTNSRAVLSGEESAEIQALIPVEGFAETLDEVQGLGTVEFREETRSSQFRNGERRSAPNGGPLLAPAVITIEPAPEPATATAEPQDDDGALETGVGILVISLAILVPLGLLTVAAYVGFDRLSRRARERALGD